MTLFQVISAPMIVAPILLYFLPESPRWLVANGRTEEAKEVMGKKLEYEKKVCYKSSIKSKQVINLGTYLNPSSTRNLTNALKLLFTL